MVDRPKTPAPIMRIESNGAGLWVVGGEAEAMLHCLRIKEVDGEGGKEQRKRTKRRRKNIQILSSYRHAC